jgi:hypothetical protein
MDGHVHAVMDAETSATVSCAECGRRSNRSEVWCLYFADVGEVVLYCPDCAPREFGTEGSDQHGSTHPTA